jgi:hypothetical protein
MVLASDGGGGDQNLDQGDKANELIATGLILLGTGQGAVSFFWIRQDPYLVPCGEQLAGCDLPLARGLWVAQP